MWRTSCLKRDHTILSPRPQNLEARVRDPSCTDEIIEPTSKERQGPYGATCNQDRTPRPLSLDHARGGRPGYSEHGDECYGQNRGIGALRITKRGQARKWTDPYLNTDLGHEPVEYAAWTRFEISLLDQDEGSRRRIICRVQEICPNPQG